MELLSNSVQLLELCVYIASVGFLTAFSFWIANDGIMALADETTLNSELTWVIYYVQYVYSYHLNSPPAFSSMRQEWKKVIHFLQGSDQIIKVGHWSASNLWFYLLASVGDMNIEWAIRCQWSPHIFTVFFLWLTLHHDSTLLFKKRVKLKLLRKLEGISGWKLYAPLSYLLL